MSKQNYGINNGINNLVQQLTDLILQRDRISQREEIIHTELLLLVNNHNTNVSSQSRKHSKQFKDCKGKIINIGDAVEFLTPTKFKGTTGIVDSFSPHRVTSINKDGQKISKASHNLIVKEKFTKSSIKNEYTRSEDRELYRCIDCKTRSQN